MDLLTQELLDLVRFDSVIGREQALCDALATRFGANPQYRIHRLGASFALEPVQRRCQQLVALVGHLDTVPPSGDNPPRIEGDRLFGLGASDMKSGLALMCQLLDRPVAEPAYDLAFVFYHGEEGPYSQSGLGPLLSELQWLQEVDLAICLEPSSNVLQLGCLGTIHAEVTFRGRAAHSARPWQGENAIYKATGLLERLAAMEAVEAHFGDLIFREVMTATTAHGGTARNVVPSRFVLNLNYRFAPGRSLQSAQQVIQGAVRDEGDIVFVDMAPSGSIPLDNAVLERFRRICAVRAEPKQAWTDVARLSEAGISAINFGPGEGAQAHQPEESTSIKLLQQGDTLLRRFLHQS